MNDVDLQIGATSRAAQAGLAELRNYGQKVHADLASTFARTFVVAGLIGATRSLIDYGDKVYDLAQRYGVATDALQKFGNAAEKEGSSLEAVALAFGKLEIAQSKALGGSAEITRHFASLGVTIDDLKNLSPEELMLRIGKSSMDAAATVAILGRNGLELRPVLKGIADGTIEMGTAIDAINIKRLADASDTFKDLGERARIFGAFLIGPILKGIDVVGDAFAELRVIGIATWEGIRAAAEGNMEGVRRAAQAQLDALSGTLQQQRQAARDTRSGNRSSLGGGLDDSGASSSSSSRSGGTTTSVSSLQSLQERLNKLNEERLEKTRSAEENLNVLQESRLELQAEAAVLATAQRSTGLRHYDDQAKGDADRRRALENQIALAKNQLEIDKIQSDLQKEQVAREREMLKIKEQILEAGERAFQQVAPASAPRSAPDISLRTGGLVTGPVQSHIGALSATSPSQLGELDTHMPGPTHMAEFKGSREFNQAFHPAPATPVDNKSSEQGSLKEVVDAINKLGDLWR